MTTRLTLFAAFVATVIAANWALSHYGLIHFLSYGPLVPAGVYFAGLAFGLRDALHETGGRRWVFTAIATGAIVSYIIEDAATIPGGHTPIAVASAVAFTLSELADLAIYEPLRERHWPAAVAASNLAGSIWDSVLFLWLAVGTTTGWFDLTWTKFTMVAVALPLVWGVRRAVPRYSLGTESA